MRCWLSQFSSTPCLFRADGQADKCHLIDQQRLKQHGLAHLCDDPRSWVYGCRYHHGQLDLTKKIRLTREQHPQAFLEFAEENGLFFTDRGWRVEAREAA